MRIEVHHGDALQTKADVLILKHAQGLYGVDLEVVQQLEQTGASVRPGLPEPGGVRLFESPPTLAAHAVLFVGVPRLGEFRYEAIREFARRGLSCLTTLLPRSTSVAMTLHGVGFGLDEAEAFRAELRGILDAAQASECPPSLQVIRIVEYSQGRAGRMQALLEGILPDQLIPAPVSPQAASPPALLRGVGRRSEQKPHVFVAMPFAPEFDDHFHYGIQRAVTTAGYLCERADHSTFTGEVLAWVRGRIASAELLVADLSTANPNVYLEVGYAWGRDIPTVLLIRQADDLKFDVKGHRCLVYDSIRTLEERLTRELSGVREHLQTRHEGRDRLPRDSSGMSAS